MGKFHSSGNNIDGEQGEMRGCTHVLIHQGWADADAAYCTEGLPQELMLYQALLIANRSGAQCTVLQAAAAVVTFVVSPVSCSR